MRYSAQPKDKMAMDFYLFLKIQAKILIKIYVKN